MGWSCGAYGKGSACCLLVGKPDKEDTAWKTKSRWKDNINIIDIEEIGWGVDWIGFAQDRDEWQAIMNCRFPYNLGNHFSK